MQLTDHELTAASSAIAMLAIIGGYLGIRAANRNALAIAREERSARQQSELDALKRTIYSEFLVVLSRLADEQISFATASKLGKEAGELWQHSVDAAQVANNKLAQLALIAPQPIHATAEEMFKRALKATDADISTLASDEQQLIRAMRADLKASQNLSPP